MPGLMGGIKKSLRPEFKAGNSPLHPYLDSSSTFFENLGGPKKYLEKIGKDYIKNFPFTTFYGLD